MRALQFLLLTLPATLLAGTALAAPTRYYEVVYRAKARPDAGVIDVEITLSGERLPSRIQLHVDPRRHQHFTSSDPLQVTPTHVVWQPHGHTGRLRYEFVVNHERSPHSYDSLMTADWAVFRAEKLVPRARVKARRNLESRASLVFELPEGWAVAAPYAAAADHVLRFDDTERRFDQPAGWFLAGKIGTRNDKIGGARVVVAAPAGESVRRQDMLAFLSFTLPRLQEVFPEFPPRLLIVSAGDPMLHGGLSGPASMFLHSSRPLISENRTSTLLHELVHIVMGIRGDEESDWIVEGFAEYYSIETLRRSGSISKHRYSQAMERLARWAQRSPTLFGSHSNGPTTARAVLVLRAVDAELRKASGGKANIDDLARKLAATHGAVSLGLLQKSAQELAGRPLQSLDRAQLTKQIAARDG